MSAPYRVLAVAATPFFVDRGGHIHIYEPIKALQERGHQVTMVTYHIGRDLPNMDIRRIRDIPWYNKTDAGPSYAKPYLALLLLLKSLQVAKETKPDIVHAHGWDSMWVAWWLWKLRGIPFIFDMQGSFAGEIAEHGYAKKGSLYFRFFRIIERLSLRSSPVAVTSSTQIYEDAYAHFALKPEQLLPIFDGVDTETFSPAAFPPDEALRQSLNLPDKPIVVFMGLLKTYQGVDDMLEAIHVMVHERGFTNFHFLILGFPDEDKYAAKAAELKIADYTTFTGKVPYHETGKYMALADLAIAPKISMTEGDAKIYFYMAMGLPVVAYKRPASEEILGDLGIYAAYNDPSDLARALHETLQDRDLMTQRGADNRQKAIKEYSWAAVAGRIENAYKLGIQRMQRPPKSGNRWWQWVRLLMGVLGLVFLIGLVDFGEVREALANANFIYLVPAWFLMIASTGFKTARWMLLLRKNEVAIRFQRLFGTYLIGAFYGQFLPGASAGGDAMRMAESSIDTGRTVNAVASVLIERAIGLISILGTASLILIFASPRDIPVGVYALIFGLTSIGLTGLLALRFEIFLGLGTRILEMLRLKSIAEKVTALSHALQGDLGEPRIIGQMVVLSILANACSMTAFYLALVAVTDPVQYLAFISLVALIVTIEIIPLTPGSLGIREGAYVFFLGYLSIPEPTALSIGLLVRLLSLTQAFIGGLVLLQRGFSRSAHNTMEPSQ